MPGFDAYLRDRNGDGIPDDVAARLVVAPAGGIAPPDYWSALIDLAARIGLECQALPMPLVIAGEDEQALPRGTERLIVATVEDVRALDWPFEGPSGKEGSTSRDAPDCLTSLFSISGLLADRDGDLLPDGTRVCFVIPDDLPVEAGAGLANLAARIGLESGGIALPLVGDGGVPFRISVEERDAALRLDGDGWVASGRPAELGALLNRIASHWPHIGRPETGGAGWSLGWLRRALAGDGPGLPEPGEIRWEFQWTARWEVDRLLDTVRQTVIPRLSPDEPLNVTVFASEPLAQRRQLAASIRHELAGRGFEQADVTVLCAFKAGLSWLREVVLPELRGRDVARIEIAYQRYEGIGDGLDLPIRWLQELFPGNEIAARELGIPLDSVTMTEMTEAGAPTYRAEAFGAAGDSLGAWECDLLHRRQPFLHHFPSQGQVCITTGGIVARQGGQTIIQPVETDLERFWEFWQREVLRRVVRDIAEDGGPLAARQPFFGELQAEVWISEPNSPLGVREENDSAAEALHEDIYFNTLDTIEVYGLETTGDGTNAPGAVVPIVHAVPGVTPHAIVRLREPPPRPALPYPNVRATALRLVDREFQIEIEVEAADRMQERQDRLRELASLEHLEEPSIQTSVSLGEISVELRLPLQRPIQSGEQPMGPPPMDEILHGDAVLDWARRLAAFPEIRGWVEDRSYQGRPLIGLSLAAPVEERLWSPMKDAILKPTALIVARHHANEISSTNAAFRLAWLCGGDPEWRALLDRLNILILPYENADGAALHARLASIQGAEKWKHHPARYNALGMEFSADFFNPTTRYGESRSRPAIWRRWPADVVVDNHGVPSHEWVQPFAGFGSPPRFRVSYWIPQALIYGIIRYVDDDAYPEHRRAAMALRDAVSAAVKDTDIGDLNREIGASYRLWGQSREPEHFPGQFHDDMLWHIATGSSDPDGRGFNVRHPATTVLSWVTEVNDETARGKHLDRVARAHLLANRAMLNIMASSAPEIGHWKTEHDDGRTTLRVGRERPLRIGKKSPLIP